MAQQNTDPREPRLPSAEARRNSSALELYSSVGLRLRAAKFDLESFTKDVQPSLTEAQQTRLNAIRRKLAGTVEDIQRVAVRQRVAILDELGAVAALNWFIWDFATIYPRIKVVLDISVAEDDVPRELREPLFLTVQEGFLNTAKHAKASEISLSLSRSDHALYLTIKDNGRGFRVNGTNGAIGKKRGMGLYNMRERLLKSRGALNLRSTVGTGTMLNIEWTLGEPPNGKSAQTIR